MTPNCDVRTVDLPVGPIDCVDTGGEGPTVVLLHGVLMNNTVWRGVMAELTPALRCVAPTLPLGAQRQPMRPGADLSVDGIALLVAEFLERRDLSDVALLMNDWGGPQLLVDHGRIERIGRLALVACEAFDKFPARCSRTTARQAGRSPWRVCPAEPAHAVRGGTPVRCAHIGQHPVSDEMLRGWFRPFARDARVRQDLRTYCLSVPLDSGRNWSSGLVDFQMPALVVWAPEDQMMPAEHGRQLADLLPDGHLVEIEDSYTH
jgi:pimeloyl-ACP methyl ester carboxylesterase